MTITHGTSKFVNAERFRDWLRTTLKPQYWYESEFDNWLDELADDHGTNGGAEFELRGFYTQSRNEELFRYDVEEHFYLWGDDEDIEIDADADNFDGYFDYASTTYIF